MGLSQTELEMIMNNFGQIINTQNRIEDKQNKTDDKVESLTLSIQGITTKCEGIKTEEELKEMVQKEIKSAGPFNSGFSSLQIKTLIRGILAFLTLAGTITGIVMTFR